MKTVGIKLADGSFYPIMEEGTAQQKKLDLTTAHNNQTCVMVDLYRSETCSMEDAEYIDTLKIENLVAHPNGEPNISFSVGLDENGELTADIEDPETGAKSNSAISLINRTLEERLTTDDYTIEPSLDSADDSNEKSSKAGAIAGVAAGAGLLAMAAALAGKNKDDSDDETIAEDSFDDIPVEEISDDDFNGIPADTITEDLFDDIPMETSTDDFDFDNDVLADIPGDDAFTADDSMAAVAGGDIFDDMPTDDASGDIFADMPTDDTFTTDETTQAATDDFDFDNDVLADMPGDDAFTADDSMAAVAGGDIFDDMPSDTAGGDIFADMPTDDAFTTDETTQAATDDFDFNNNVLADMPGDDAFTADDSMTAVAGGDIFDDMPSDTAGGDIFADMPSDNAGGDIFADMPSDDAFTTDETTQAATDDFDFDNDVLADMPGDDAFTADDSMAAVAGGDIFADMPSDDDFANDLETSSLDDSNDFVASNNGISFTGLYDKETAMGNSSRHEDEEVKKNTKAPVIICVICAIICLIATALLLFIIPSKYNLIIKKNQKAPVVSEAPAEPKSDAVIEKSEDTNSTPSIIAKPEPVPEAKEDEVIIIEAAEEVIPLPPPVIEKEKPKDIKYKIKWGDTLWDIADTYYKNPWKYHKIATFNNIKNPDYIISGTTILIPAE